MKIRSSRGVFFVLAALLWVGVAVGQIETAQSGNWNAAGTWVGGVIPTTGPVTIRSGHTVTLTAAKQVPTAVALTVNGVLDLGGNNQVLSTVAGSGTIIKSSSDAHRNLTIGSDVTSIFDGVIGLEAAKGRQYLTKVGSGTLVLNGDNGYNGETIVEGGTLKLSGSNAASGTVVKSGRLELVEMGVIGSGPLLLGNGAVFDVSGRDATLVLANEQGVTVNGAATLETAVGKGVTLGSASTLHLAGFDGVGPSLAVTGGGALTLQSGNAVTVTVGGETPLSAGDYTLIAGGVTGTLPTVYPCVTGAGRVANSVASLLIEGGDLVLRIVAYTPLHTPADIATQTPGGEWHDPATWLGGIIPGPGDRVTISNDVDLCCGTFALESLTLTNSAKVVFQNWHSLLSATNIVLSSGVITAARPFNSYTNHIWQMWIPSNRVAISCASIFVGAAAAIDVSGKGYLGGYYDWPGNLYIAAHGPEGPAAGRYIGGSHAAAGGRGGAAPYGNRLQPTQPGSGGGVEYTILGDKVEPNQAKGHGGGVISIDAAGVATVDGTIKADGINGTYSCGGGAGGSILLNCRAILGKGRIASDGGKGATTGCGGGSGGRIAIYYDAEVQATYPVPLLVISSGTNPSDSSRTLDSQYNSRVGSVVVPDYYFLTSPIRHCGSWHSTSDIEVQAYESLIVTNAWLHFDQEGLQLVVTNDLEVKNNGRLEWTGATVECGSLLLDNYGIVTMDDGGAVTVGTDVVLGNESFLKVTAAPTNGLPYGALVTVGDTLDISGKSWLYPVSNPTNGGSVKIACRDAIIGVNSGINADGAGFGFVDSKAYGPGAAKSWGGAGYGGVGGLYPGSGGGTYGSSNDVPLSCGSAASQVTGYGGGLIWLQAQKKVELNGILTAVGGGTSATYDRGGSGGGIYVESVEFGGSGSLVADGGIGGSSGSAAGGGGGRIHVARVKDVANSVTTSVVGRGNSAGTPANFGMPGTVCWTMLPPVEADIESRAATNVTASSATLNAFLVTTGASATVVSVYWGEIDGGDEMETWDNITVLPGEAVPGWVSATVALQPGREYFYRFAASNEAGFAWSHEPAEYLLSDGVTISFSPASVSEAGGVATATVSRAATVVSEAITVYYEIAGTAVSGIDYNELSGEVTLPKGVASVSFTLTAVPDAESSADKTVELSLVGGLNYALGTTAKAELTIRNAEIAAMNISLADGNWHDRAIWSAGHVPVTPQAIVVTNNVILGRDTAALESLTLNGGSITFSNWTTRLIATNVVLNGGTITCAGPFNSYVNDIWPVLEPSNRVHIVCDNLTVAEGAAIDVSGRGYRGGFYADSVYYDAHGPGGGGRSTGGSHAARGGNSNSKLSYGDPLRPMAPGSGGGSSYTSNSGKFGHGGGAIYIEATGIVTIDGNVWANGVSVTASDWGAGAGGSILIDSRRIAGSGKVQAQGGSGSGGSGSGGRIAVYYDPLTQAAYSVPSLAISTRSLFAGAWAYDGAKHSRIGTVVVPDDYLLTSPTRHDGIWMPISPFPSLALGALVLDNKWLRLGGSDRQLVLAADSVLVKGEARFELVNTEVSCNGLVITNKGVMELYGEGGSNPGLTVEHDAVLADKSYFTVYAGEATGVGTAAVGVEVGGRFDIFDNAWIYPWSHPTNGGSTRFAAGALTIAADSGINGVGKGYKNRVDAPAVANGGPGWGGDAYAGGGYGGRGGGDKGGAIYGDERYPLQCGSASGDTSTYGTPGGGLIWLKVAGRFVLDGVLNASGTSGSSIYGSGGSGGGVYVSCRLFAGTSGSLVADGGSGGTHTRGGGGGGRIAVWRVRHAYTGGLPSVKAGEGFATVLAEDGTVYWGDLPASGTIMMLR